MNPVNTTHFASGKPKSNTFAILAMAFALVLGFAPEAALAQGAITVPFIQDFGCSIVQWLKGPMAILIFIVVCVVTLVFGMITKMDWGKIITVCIIFGVILGLGKILLTYGDIANMPGMSACLQ